MSTAPLSVAPSRPTSRAPDDAPSDQTGEPERPGDFHERVVTEHLGLAQAMASRFTGRGVERDDLFQVAYLGLVKAARRYDPAQGSFSAFAAPTVLGELKRHFRDRGWMVRPPRWIQELQFEIRGVVDTYMQDHGESPSDEQIAAELDTDIARVREARGARGCFAPRSVDTSPHAADRPLRDTVPVEDTGYDLIDDVMSLAPACRRLDRDDRDLLRMRFIEERTQQDIADELGISQMQVSRRLSRLLRRLRSTMMPDAA